MIAGVAVTVKDARRQVGVWIAGLALHRDGHGNRHRDRGAQTTRDRAVVRLSTPELRAVQVGT